MARNKPTGLTREQIESMLVEYLAGHQWYDISDDCPDPDAVECVAYGHIGESMGETVFMLARYEDDGARFSLVSYIPARAGHGRSVTKDQELLAWLWEQVHPLRLTA